MATGLNFPLNGANFVNLQWLTLAALRTSGTIIFDVICHDNGPGYLAWWWFHHNSGADQTAKESWDNGVYNIGFHPYPSGTGVVNSNGYATEGAAGNPRKDFEIAGGGGTYDQIANAGSTVTYGVNAYFEVKLKQAIRNSVVNISGTDYVKSEYFVDLNDTSKVLIHYQTLASIPSRPNAFLALGGSLWRKTHLDENAGAIFLNLSFFDDPLINADIVSESNRTTETPVTTAGLASVVYSNLNPTPTDVSDKSGSGNNPTWYNANRPSLWNSSGSNLPAGLGFNSDADFLVKTVSNLNFNSPFTVQFAIKLLDVESYGHFWSAIVGSSGAGDYENSDFIGHSNSGDLLRIGAIKTGGTNTYPEGSALSRDVWMYLTFIRESATSLKAYINITAASSPDITDTNNITGRGSVGSELIGRLNNGYGIRLIFANLKQWSKALTKAQAEAEKGKAFAVETDQLHDVWNFPDNANRYVGEVNGITWTPNGTITVEEAPTLELPSGIDATGATSASAQTLAASFAIVKPLSISNSNSAQIANGSAKQELILSAQIASSAQTLASALNLSFNIFGNTSSQSQQNSASFSQSVGISISGNNQASGQSLSASLTVVQNLSAALIQASQIANSSMNLANNFSGSLNNASQALQGLMSNGEVFSIFGNTQSSSQIASVSAKLTFSFIGSNLNSSQDLEASSVLILNLSGSLSNQNQSLQTNLALIFTTSGFTAAAAQDLDAALSSILLNQFSGNIANSLQVVSGNFSLFYNIFGNTLSQSQVADLNLINGTFEISDEGFLTYSQAVDEIFSKINLAWLLNSEAIIAYVPVLFWQGVTSPNNPPVNLFWGRVSQETVMERQAAFTDLISKKRYEVSGLVTVEIYCPRSVANSMSLGRKLATIAKDAFRGTSTSGRVWFRNSSIKELLSNEKFHRLSVIAEYEYDELK